MAMIKNKRITFSLFLVCLVVVSPMAKAQLGISNILIINALLDCVLSGRSGPAFPNSLVQLQCQNQTVASSTTSITGIFSITVPVQISLPDLLSRCQIVVVRPLSNCTPSLPSAGSLASGTLSTLGNIVSSTLNTTIVIPTRIVLIT